MDGLSFKELNQENIVAAGNFNNLIAKNLPSNHITPDNSDSE